MKNKTDYSNREIDGMIAEEIFGWVLVPVGADAKGEGKCEILAPHKDMSQDWYNTLPLKGAIGKNFACENYTDSMSKAVSMSLKVGYNPDLKLHDLLVLTPKDIAWSALQHFRALKSTPQ